MREKRDGSECSGWRERREKWMNGEIKRDATKDRVHEGERGTARERG